MASQAQATLTEAVDHSVDVLRKPGGQLAVPMEPWTALQVWHFFCGLIWVKMGKAGKCVVEGLWGKKRTGWLLRGTTCRQPHQTRSSRVIFVDFPPRCGPKSGGRLLRMLFLRLGQKIRRRSRESEKCFFFFETKRVTNFDLKGVVFGLGWSDSEWCFDNWLLVLFTLFHFSTGMISFHESFPNHICHKRNVHLLFHTFPMTMMLKFDFQIVWILNSESFWLSISFPITIMFQITNFQTVWLSSSPRRTSTTTWRPSTRNWPMDSSRSLLGRWFCLNRSRKVAENRQIFDVFVWCFSAETSTVVFFDVQFFLNWWRLCQHFDWFEKSVFRNMAESGLKTKFTHRNREHSEGVNHPILRVFFCSNPDPPDGMSNFQAEASAQDAAEEALYLAPHSAAQGMSLDRVGSPNRWL